VPDLPRFVIEAITESSWPWSEIAHRRTGELTVERSFWAL